MHARLLPRARLGWMFVKNEAAPCDLLLVQVHGPREVEPARLLLLKDYRRRPVPIIDALSIAEGRAH